MSGAADRHLDWEGCCNVRDLGGLPTVDGRMTRRGAVVRADTLGGLTAAGWEALVAHGVRTVVDLRNDDELGADAAPRPAHVTTVHVALDASEDREFWDVWGSGPQFATPLYYRPHLECFPERSVAAVRAIARAVPAASRFTVSRAARHDGAGARRGAARRARRRGAPARGRADRRGRRGAAGTAARLVDRPAAYALSRWERRYWRSSAATRRA